MNNSRIIQFFILVLLFLFNNLANSQSNNQMEKKYTIFREEFPITEERVNKFEQEKNINFPSDYRKFLLEYNGGVVMPNYPVSKKLKIEIDPIERFYSLQDIELGCIDNQRERIAYVKEDIDEGRWYLEEGNVDWGFDIELDKLIFIGVCDRGTLHLYCGKNGYGEIWYSNYSGGEGLINTGLKSFSELLNSLSDAYEDLKFDKNNPIYTKWLSDKIFKFAYSFFWEDDIKELSLERFKEVLSFYGDPNKIHSSKNSDVVSFYINYPIILKYLVNSGAKYPNKFTRINNVESLKFLVSLGANIEGLLNNTWNVEILKYLVEEQKQDLNKSFDGRYPLLIYTNLDGLHSEWQFRNRHKYIQEILKLGYDLNLDIKDKKGQSVKDRIKILEERYKQD